MKMSILARGIAMTEAIRQYAQRRMTTALGRYRQALGSIYVRLSDVNGPRGGMDKHCVIEVRGAALVPIVIRERDADLYVAIDRAAGRIDRAVARRLARIHTLEIGSRRNEATSAGSAATWRGG